MKVLFEKDYSELKMIVYKKEDIGIIKDVIANYPVAWDTVKEMLLSGLDATKIRFLCREWDSRRYIISDVWNELQSLITKSELILRLDLLSANDLQYDNYAT